MHNGLREPRFGWKRRHRRPAFPALLAVPVAFLAGCISSVVAAPGPAAGLWALDGDLRDSSGHGNEAHCRSAEFVAGHRGQGLRTAAEAAIIPDAAELRLAPGLRVECWVRLDAIPAGGLYFLVKGDEYMLRVDPASEGGQFAFFVYLDGWEPRVRSEAIPKPGGWYHLVASWDGAEMVLEVDGAVTRGPRAGVPFAAGEPLSLNLMGGVIDDLRIDNPGARQTGVAHWAFDGDLRDDSGRGRTLAAENARFVSGRSGQALECGQQLQVPSAPDLQLAPGLRIDCSVRFEQLPADYGPFVIKDGEYQLRLDSQREGGRFSFFVNLGGWEPRVQSEAKVEAGIWYRLMARWDGSTLSLDVNGERTQVGRSGPVRKGDQPLGIGTPGALLDDLRIENPRLPVLRIRSFTQERTILRAGRAETFTAAVENLGPAVENAELSLELPSGVTCLGGLVHGLGALPPGAARTAQWALQAETALSTTASLRLTAAGCRPVVSRRTLAFFPAQDGPSPAVVPQRATGTPAASYYVDSVGGDNANPGTSPEAPWRDFGNINGRALAAGERLLIKRGSVLDQELSISAAGTADNWAEIGAYGTGARPVVRRRWDIGDRCVLVRNPDYLLIRNLVVCHAAKGLVVSYQDGRHQGLVIEDCIAHHIEGLYRTNAHGIPEWRDREGAAGDGLGSSAGIAIVGAPAKDLVLRDCEMFQCSWGFFVSGDAVTVDRVFCHDNYAHNTSPHPALVGVRRSFLQNSIFDAPGWHASAGTMGIMLVDPQGLIIRNCIFRNQPDSGSHDEGGIDFENRGDGCLIEHCTFENNAGAAIEVLGLKVPQPRSVEICHSRFIRNNTARKLGPAEIYVWGKGASAEVCCSTGTIHDNGYVLNPGVEFFVNEAPKTTVWTVQDNTRYDTPATLRQAMPFNEPPTVSAGTDVRSDLRTVPLAGRVRDDGKPGTGPLVIRWEVLEGPGSVTFQDAGVPETAAEFSVPGDYLLRLVADDGELWLSDTLVVHILPAGTTVAGAWEFNTPLDREGWTEVNPGTRLREWSNQKWPTRSEPVKYVAGGYYILAIEDSPDAHLLSPDGLNVDLATNRTVRIRFQNHTPATRMRLRFTTTADAAWDEAKSRSFEVVPNDDGPRGYAVDLSTVPGWTGRLKQLRLDLATGTPLTGTCRFDSIWLDNSLAATPAGVIPARGQ